MADDPDKTFPPASKAQLMLARYNAAEGWFDSALVIIGAMKYTLLLFAGWTLFVAWASVKVFG